MPLDTVTGPLPEAETEQVALLTVALRWLSLALSFVASTRNDPCCRVIFSKSPLAAVLPLLLTLSAGPKSLIAPVTTMVAFGPFADNGVTNTFTFPPAGALAPNATAAGISRLGPCGGGSECQVV